MAMDTGFIENRITIKSPASEYSLWPNEDTKKPAPYGIRYAG